MQFSRILLPIVLAASFALPAASAASPKEDTDRVVELTTTLETEPLGNDAIAQRKWLLQWLTDTPDFTVTVCNILGPIPGEDVPNGPELMVQQMFGNVAYQIKHPGTKDEVPLQIAGVESALRAYAAFLAQDPRARIPYLDTLLAKKQAGSLLEHMSPAITKSCANGGGA